MNRNEKIFSVLNKDGLGLEIGPSYSPIAPKFDGYNVHVLDHLSREDLIEKYKNDKNAGDLSKIEAVDYVWKGGSFCDLIGKEGVYDWIIASHLIEHVPDFIGFLLDCAKLLKDDGVLSFVVPDKRFCFDFFRPLTGLSEVVDAHLRKQKQHSPGKVLEALLYYTSCRDEIAWNQNQKFKNKFQLGLSEEFAVSKFRESQESVSYIDVHGWCFTPSLFRLLIQDLYALDMIPLKEISFFPTEGCEFYCSIGKQGLGTGLSRLELMSDLSKEQSHRMYGTANGPSWFRRLVS